MLIKKLIIGLLSFYTFEIKRASLKDNGSLLSSTSIERLYESRKKREQERKKTRTYDKRKWKEKKKYREKHYKFKNSTPKDVRFSDQQKLRRMYRST